MIISKRDNVIEKDERFKKNIIIYAPDGGSNNLYLSVFLDDHGIIVS